MEIVYVYQKKRKDFGRQALLSERPPELTVDIMPDPSYLANYVEQNPVTTEVQCAAEMSEHEVGLWERDGERK
jgi:dynein intermediate chain 2